MTFRAKIRLLGVNPYVTPPRAVLEEIFAAAERATSPIPVRGVIEQTPFTQGLVRYQGAWRLYLNTPMRKGAGKQVGDTARFELAFDPAPPVTPMPPALERALARDAAARAAFEALPQSRRKEIQRYLNNLKRPETLARNLEHVLEFLGGKAPRGALAVLRVRP